MQIDKIYKSSKTEKDLDLSLNLLIQKQNLSPQVFHRPIGAT